MSSTLCTTSLPPCLSKLQQHHKILCLLDIMMLYLSTLDTTTSLSTVYNIKYGTIVLGRYVSCGTLFSCFSTWVSSKIGEYVLEAIWILLQYVCNMHIADFFRQYGHRL